MRYHSRGRVGRPCSGRRGLAHGTSTEGMMTRNALSILAILILGASPSANVTFTQPPAVAKKGERMVVTFALSKATDVEVAVLNGKGDVVRHLAAGVLGSKTAPPPPLAAGLSQSLEWDGADDLGAPATGGPFRVRVRAGLSVTFGGFVGEDPYT